MEIRKYGRNWAVFDKKGDLVCLTVYKRGAVEVVRRLKGLNAKEGKADGLGDVTRNTGNCH